MSDHSFPKSLRLRTSREYKRMAHGYQRYVGRWIVIDVRPSEKGASQLGITVTRRFGKAHQRNRFKRIVREAFRLTHSQFSGFFTIVVKPRTFAHQAIMQDIKAELLFLIEKATQWKKN